jgi:hypothetical protein
MILRDRICTAWYWLLAQSPDTFLCSFSIPCLPSLFIEEESRASMMVKRLEAYLDAVTTPVGKSERPNED